MWTGGWVNKGPEVFLLITLLLDVTRLSWPSAEVVQEGVIEKMSSFYLRDCARFH